jgi:GNAT superfamily N-acetyltransferase
MVREIREDDLQSLLELYLFLHEESIPEMTAHLQETWKSVLADANHHIIVKEAEGKIVSSCVCVVIPNLTRGIRPYAFVENVVTHKEFRGKGYATECLAYAKKLAEAAGCYKMMLLTGSKEDSTLAFYRRAGYNSRDKMAFVQWL